MYKRLFAFALCLILLIGVLSFLPVHGESQLYQSVVRLHVLANSDSDEDQNLKLIVRDKVLEKATSLLSECNSQKEAQTIIESNLYVFESVAQSTVISEGYEYEVSIKLSDEEYPTKSYESCCFPSGNYLSLQILIGEAKGQNWWCVLFPPLCLSAASEGSEAFAEVGLTGEQYNVITETENPKYKVRFKLLEVFDSALKK